ncbi:MAG: DUF4924 family protein [Bacteroidales bacterium]|nr:DUF4924 family protein [Bacteroidales bacterium]
MLIAKEKRNENVAEYILYMWQLEDLLRGCNFDINIVEREIVENLRLAKNKRCK